MTRGRVAWVLGAADLAVFLVVLAVDPAQDYVAGALYLAGVLSFTWMGALLLNRLPGNPVGVLLCATGTLVVATNAVGVCANIGLSQSPPWALADTALDLRDALFIMPILIAIVGVPLVFPDGRLPSPRYRWVVALLVAGAAAWFAGAVFGAPVDIVVLVSVPVAFLGGLSSVLLRFRRGTPVQRAQVKWLAAIVVVAATGALSGLFLWDSSHEISNVLMSIAILAMLAMPVTIAVAILRYRLYDIDRVISRGIAYALVTGILAATFGATVLALQSILAPFTQGQTVAVAASTLAVFAVSSPVLRRIRGRVDRRFDRARYNAERTAAAFSDRLRDEVDMATVTADLARTATTALAPTSFGIWIREP